MHSPAWERDLSSSPAVVATAPGYADERKQKEEEEDQTDKMPHKNFYCHYQKFLCKYSLQSPDYGVFLGWVETSSPSLVYHGSSANKLIFRAKFEINAPIRN